MLRRSFMPRMFRPTVALAQFGGASNIRAVPQGWDFLENKVEDRELTGTFEQPQNVTLTLTRQDEFIMKLATVKSLNICTVSGELGIRAGHEYKIAKLAPGVIAVEKTEGQPTTNYFASGGFAQINNDGSVDINTVECIPMDDIEPAYVDRELLAATENLRNAKNEKEKAIAEIAVTVFEALQTACKAQHA